MKKSKICDDKMLYAGAVCPKCRNGINNEMPVDGFEEIKERQRKRYGNKRLCNKCILSFASRI